MQKQVNMKFGSCEIGTVIFVRFSAKAGLQLRRWNGRVKAKANTTLLPEPYDSEQQSNKCNFEP
jgi:hypothetical protein